jgi:hypothetical protein
VDKIHLEYMEILMEQHRLLCFESGDHHEEITTPYSAGADAIARVFAAKLKEGSQ